jgi:uncharacterized protein (TIGR02147 family)
MYYLNKGRKKMKAIYTYQDYRSFLRDFYADCNARNPRFSLRSFASKVDLNVSTITRILKGQRNISEETRNRIAAYLKLRERETEYFNLLVHYTQARNTADKCALYEQIRLFRKTRLRNLGREYNEYFSNWYNVALRELLTLMPRKTQSRQLAKMLMPSPKANDIRKSFNLLIRLGLVKQNADGCLELADKFVSTPDEWTGTAIHAFQAAMSELGTQALDRFPKAERDISTLTLSLSRNGLSLAKVVLRRAREEILAITKSDLSVDRVYELNLQLFPLSKSRGEQK